VQFWDVAGEQGAAVRAVIGDMGPILLSRLLQLNDTQAAVLTVIFKLAADEKLELVDLKDLRKLLEYASANASPLAANYGKISTASVGAIQRGLVALEQEGAGVFFGEPALDIDDLMQTRDGKGVINILAADKLMNSPKVYVTFLLWLLTKLFDVLPEVGDPEKPKLVFFFDEAHLLFNGASKVLLEKVEQVVRLIRSKGVGIYFISQSPSDIPESVLAQLGNRVQHALRAYTPKDQKALASAARSFRPNPAFNTETAIAELSIGEAIISCLDETGAPRPVERAFVLPPQGQIGPLDKADRDTLLRGSPVYKYYSRAVDRETAYELLSKQPDATLSAKDRAAREKAEARARAEEEKSRAQTTRQTKREAAQSQRFWKSLVQSIFGPLARNLLTSFFRRRR
jgi:DNA helicase HerA-like ATPase